MELRRLNISRGEEVSFVENLYIESFPLSERRPVGTMLDLYKEKGLFVILVAEEDNNTVGFLTYWDLDGFIFAEHFAISPEFRNGGYGRKVMDLFIGEMDKPIVLEVELPTTILSERRIGFYQRIGFRLWENIKYHQPAYHNEGNPIPMILMSYGDIDIEMDFMEVKGMIYSEVYNS
ncbi:MAG: GNAT family N-acetyltransferase [Prevotella sp.]|jgi:ribosomal protein S18 acetylase RimI-like enzyme|nr:GNAT family N-acetyltransferase [Prevotella sp.]